MVIRTDKPQTCPWCKGKNIAFYEGGVTTADSFEVLLPKSQRILRLLMPKYPKRLLQHLVYCCNDCGYIFGDRIYNAITSPIEFLQEVWPILLGLGIVAGGVVLGVRLNNIYIMLGFIVGGVGFIIYHLPLDAT